VEADTRLRLHRPGLPVPGVWPKRRFRFRWRSSSVGSGSGPRWSRRSPPRTRPRLSSLRCG